MNVIILGLSNKDISLQAHEKRGTPALKNVFNEYVRDLDFPYPTFNSLDPWKQKGIVFVTEEQDTKETLSLFKYMRRYKDTVYMLWGRKAQEYEARIDAENNLILKADHPDHRNGSFLGCSHFTQAADYLRLPYKWWRLP